MGSIVETEALYSVLRQVVHAANCEKCSTDWSEVLT